MKCLLPTIVVGCLGVTALVVFAQMPASSPAKPGPVTAPAPQAPPYSYNSEGRRDPFVSLLHRGRDVGRVSGRPADGVGGMLVNELVLKGVMLSRGHYVAIVQGPDNKAYIVRPNDRLADGSIKAITADGIVLMQDVNDPLSPTKQREVRKALRALVEQK